MAMKHFGIFLGAALLVGAGCSSSRENTRRDTGMGAPTAGNYPSDTSSGQGSTMGEESIAREKDALISQADGSQLGTLRDYSGTTLTVDADQAGGMGGMTVRVDNSVPVFQGEQKVSTDALVPGSDVRVFYRTPTDGTQPRAVAIEILSTGENSTLPGSEDDSGLQQPSSPDDSGTMPNEDTGSFGTDSDDESMDQGMDHGTMEHDLNE